MAKYSLRYRIIRALVKFFYPKPTLCGTENLPDGPCIIVGNHCQMDGPICAELYVPGPHYIWCAGEMTSLKTVPEYAYRDFWSKKPKWIRWLFKLASYLVAPLAVSIFGKGGAGIIEVYHDTRLIRTFRESTRKLSEGANIVIFPEHDPPVNNIVYDFQDRFSDIAYIYYKQTGKCVSFVPLYIAPQRREMHFGEPVVFDPSASKDQERERIKTCIIMSET